MRRAFTIIFRIRALCTAVTLFSACGPSTSTSIFPSYRHPLLNHQSGSVRPESTVTIRPDARPQRATLPRTFSHPLLNRGASLKSSSVLTQELIDNRLAIARQARSMLTAGHEGFRVGGRKYRRDCSGFVMAVLAAQGLKIDELLGRQNGSGVAAIYRLADDLGTVHHRKVPSIGDLVFFDNTYDRNRDGRPNDLLTHVGIVERVDPDGTVSVIHHVRRGVLRYKLNRFQPGLRRDPKSRKVLNHYLRVVPSGSRRSDRRLTGELFHAFATIIR